MKKQLTLILLAIFLPLVANADIWQDPETKVNYSYTVGMSEASVVAGNWAFGGSPNAKGAIIILSKFIVDGNTYSVTSIGDYAFSECSGLTSVTIPNSVISIGNSAFYYCTGLTEVNYNATNCTSMGDSSYPVFSGCSSLTTLNIGNNVLSIPNYAFFECSALTSVTIGNSVTSIGRSAFCTCRGLTSVTIPNSVTSIGNNAFGYCSDLTSVTIPNSVTSIEDYAFQGCDGLTSITIPNSVTSIGDCAFRSCGGLTKVNYNATNCTSMGSSVFSDCSSLTTLNIGNNVLSIPSFAFSGRSSLTSVTIPNSVTRIGNNAFEYCRGLTSVTIPNSVTSIGNNAFANCSGLTSLTIPNSVTSIGDYAFEYCSSLTEVNYNAINCTSMGDPSYPVFFRCSSLTTLNIGDNVQSIPSHAFRDCSGLMSLTIGNSVTSIGSSAFYNCNDLTSVTIPNSVTSIGSGAFYKCYGLTSISFGNSVTSIGDDAFKYCSGLTSVTIPNSVTSIGSGAFNYCSGLTSMKVEEGNTVYDSRNNCNAIIRTKNNALRWGCKNTVIPNSVTSIEGSAFSNCSGLTSITIPNSVTSIGGWSFSSCSSLASITIPNSVTYIGACAFSGCSSLTSMKVKDGNTVYDSRNNCNAIIETETNTLISGCKNTVIPNSVTSIGYQAFGYCSSLTSVTIPNSVTSIGNWAFSGCNSLISITSFIKEPFSISSYVCDNDTYNSAILYVPFGTIDAYKATKGWKNFKNIEELEAGSSLTLSVANGDGADVTDKVSITWHDTNGKEIGTGKSLNGIKDGTELYYSVMLNEELGCMYREVKMQKVVAKEGEPLICQLEKIGHVTLEGRVSATDIDKTTMTVNVQQMLNGKWEQNYTAQTNEQGVFKVEEIFDDQTDITISGEGYLNATIHRDGFSGNGNVGTIPMSLISGFAIAANITMQKNVAEGEAETITAWNDALNNIDFTLTNTTKGIAITDFTVQNGNVIIKTGANIGDEISLTAKSKQGVFADAMTTFTIEDGANAFDLQLTELGGVDATCTASANGSTSGYLYNNSGVLVAKGGYTGETLSLRHLPSGNYTLVSMGNSMLFGSMTQLADIAAVGLQEGVDYVTNNVTVTDGELTEASVSDVPQLDDTRFYYTSGNTYFNTNMASVTAGNYLTLQAHVDFKPEYAGKADVVTLTIDLPEGCQMVENSVIANRQAVPHTVNGNRVTITLNEEQYGSQVRFCIIPTLNQSYTISAMASFDIDGLVTQPIGIAQFEAKGLSLNTPSLTARTNITISGTAKGHSEVSIYDNDVLIGKTSSKADGSWITECELYKPYSHSFHDIYAKITTENGMELTSETKQVEYDKNSLVPEKVTMLYYGYKTEFDLLEGTTSPSYYSYAPSIHDFTFLADFTRNDSTVIKNVNIKVLNSDGTVRTLPATFDGKQNKWVATTKYSSSSRLPQNVTVEYDLLSVSKIYDEEMEDAMNTLISNMAIEVDNAYKDCEIELTAEDENTISFIATTNGYLTKEKCTIAILDYEKVDIENTGKSVYHIEDDTTDVCFVLKEFDDYRSSIIAWDNKNKTAFEIRTGEPQHTNFSNVRRILPFILNAAYGAAASIYEYNLRMGIINDWIRTYEADKRRHYRNYDNMINKLYARCPDGSYKIKDKSKRNSLKSEADQCLNNAEKFHDKFEQVLITQQNRLQSVCTLKGLTSMAISAAGSFLNGVGTVFSNAKGAIVQALGKAINNYAIRAGTTLASNGTSDALGYVVEHPKESDGNRRDITPEKIISDWYFENSPKVNGMFVQTSNSIRLSYSNCNKEKEDENEEEKKDEPMDEKSENKDDFPGNGSTALIDPSGFVYEAVLTNRLEGVTTTCYQQENGAAVLWNAEDYSQQNPLKTDETGFYRWDVPQGMWQVKYEKEGYETAYSDWLPVPPPQLDVNIGMRQSTPPTVKQMRGYESGITIELGKYMRPETMTTEKITVTRNGSAEAGSIELMNAEQAPLGDETFVSKVKFVPENRFNTTDLVVVTVRKEVESYCGIQMTADHVETVKIESEVKSILADSVVTVPYQGERELRVLILPKDASAGRTLKVKTSSSMIASVSSEEVTIGQDGAATLTLGGELPGGAVLDFSVEGTDVSAISKVKVVMGRELVATPVANISSGETIDGGTQIKLSCATEGATIYYTLDGSCPCDEDTRKKYDGPFPIATDVVVKAIAVKDDMDDSDIATFVYIVDGINDISYANRFDAIYLDGSVVVTGAKGAICHIYDLQGRELATRLHLSQQATISVPKTEVYVVSVTFDDGQTVVRKVVRNSK